MFCAVSRLLVMATTVAASVNPAWVLTGHEANNAFVTYLDVASRYKVGAYTRAWVSKVYRDGTLYGQQRVFAQKSLREFDCAGRRSRAISYNLYLRNGQLLRTFNAEDPEWDYSPPRSMGAAEMEAACDLRRGEPQPASFDPVLSMDGIIEALVAGV